jgi:cell cycle checkpoint protein
MQSSNIDPLFTASTTSVGHMFRVLKAIGLLADEASVTISDQGIKFSVDAASHVCQAHLFLTTSLFSSYEFKSLSEEDQYVTFNISLKALTGCLQMFAAVDQKPVAWESRREKSIENETEMVANSSCIFMYNGPGSSFLVYFKEGRTMTTKCQLATYYREIDSAGEDSTDIIVLDPETIVQKVIIRGSILEDALKGLEAISTQVVTIRASTKSPHFTLISHGDVGTSEFVFPNERSVLETFIVTAPGAQVYDRQEHGDIVIRNSYQFALVNKAKEAVHLASRVSLRCDASGVMSIQSMCELGDGRQSFVDFRFVPNAEGL